MNTQQLSQKQVKYAEERERRISRRRLLEDSLNERFLKYYKAVLAPLFDSECSADIPDCSTSPSIDLTRLRTRARNWCDFTAMLQIPLHVVFRVTQSHQCAPELTALLHDLHVAQGVAALPTGVAYECNNAQYDIPRIKEVFQVLNASALLTFQESVSMLPSLALIRSLENNFPPAAQSAHWHLLDTCAAPASKSLHLLDAMATARQTRGVLLSVEFDKLKATQNLPARLKRAQSPCCFAIYGDATRLPILYSEAKQRFVEFDGTLCDVPCSGDGTCRKDNTIQKNWDESYAAKLHKKQCAILRRGLAATKPAGLCVYSTCSLNPIENECVVLRCACDGDSRPLEVHDLPKLIPEFAFSPAVVPTGADGEGTEFEAIEAEIARCPSREGFTFRTAMTDSSVNPSFIGRVLPHVNNSGGFFTTLLQKISAKPESCEALAPPGFSLKSCSHWGGYKKFRELTPAESELLLEYYGVDTKHLAETTGYRFVVHGVNDDKPKRILLLSEGCYDLLHARVHKAKKETITHVGVRVFSFWNSKLFTGEAAERYIPFRTTNEGAQHLAPLSSGGRVVHLCALRHLGLLHSLLDNGTCMSASLGEAFTETSEGVSVGLRECFEALRPQLLNPHVVAKFTGLCQNDRKCCSNLEESAGRRIAPGPLWVAMHLCCLRKASGGSHEAEPCDGPSTCPSIAWLSGVLYFSRLELTTKEPIRKGISLVVHNALSKLL